MAGRTITVATHSGSFHLDDALACAILRGFLGNIRITRTRDPAAVKACDFAVDVSGEYEPSRLRYDHHMRVAHERPDGLRYSAAGLVWLHHGRDWLSAQGVEGNLIDKCWKMLDETFIRSIDEIDNGIRPPEPSSLAIVVDDLNQRWDDTHADQDAAFEQALSVAAAAIAGRMRSAVSALRAEAVVEEAWRRSADGRTIVMDRPGLPWKEAAHALGLPVVFGVYPKDDTGWVIECMTPEPGSYGQVVPLPEAWAGLSGDDLTSASGVADAVFAHRARFIAGARSLDGVLSMARIALECRPSPGP
jgi:uncharacterized UPF0160 family protein